MSRASGTGGGRQAIVAYRKELLERLGIEDGATDQDIETAHEALTSFLAGAPNNVAGWVGPRQQSIDEAFALLSGPPEALAESALDRVMAQRAETPPPAPTTRTKSSSRPVVAEMPQRRFPWIPLGVIAALIGIVVGVWWVGRGDDLPAMPANAQASPSDGASSGVDQQRVMELMQNITDNPKDVPSLRELGDIYYNAGDYLNAQTWQEKVLEIKPGDRDASLKLGACYYGQDKRADAEALWLKTEKAYPKDPAVHFYLGFYYFTDEPRQEAKMTAQWNKVIELDPTSEWAKSAKAHLASLKSENSDS